MPKEALRCKQCRNKVGEFENGVATFRHKGRTISAETGGFPFVIKVGCETCKADTVFELCLKEVVAK